jgi:hypothetical protein
VVPWASQDYVACFQQISEEKIRSRDVKSFFFGSHTGGALLTRVTVDGRCGNGRTPLKAWGKLKIQCQMTPRPRLVL